MRLGPSLLTLTLALLASVPGAPRAGEPTSPPRLGPEIKAASIAADLAPTVSVTVKRTAVGLEIEGRTRLRAMSAVAWDVLTDYDNISRFVSSISVSRVTRRSGDDVLVEQSAVGRLFIFRRGMTTVLQVHEEPLRCIRFEDVLGRDFKSYRGQWLIEDHGRQVEIVYRLTAEPSFHIPDVVARGAFRRAVRSLITEVGVEIEARARLVRG